MGSSSLTRWNLRPLLWKPCSKLRQAKVGLHKAKKASIKQNLRPPPPTKRRGRKQCN